MEKLISIIIPIYNVEEYLTDCLESVRRNIEGLEAEVLLIDDGSTDTSSMIAQLYAENAEKFFYYRKENGGLSSARNYGVSLASGKYLFFVDSDDLLTDGILSKMIATAEHNSTELTVCNVARLKGKLISESFLHVRAFNNLRTNISHIKKHPNFVYDATSWNKLILRSFYLKYGITFPEGYVYEDMLPNFRLHYLCNGVSVIRDIGYLWRIRTGANKQITQDFSKKTITDKNETMRQLLDYIQDIVPEAEIQEAVVTKLLGFDCNLLLNQLCFLSKEEVLEYVHLVRDFASHPVNKRNLNKLPLIKQQLYQNIFEGDFSHLLQIINYMNTNYSRVPIVTTGSGLAMKVPDHFFKMNERSAMCEFTNQVLPSCAIDRVTIEGTGLFMQGHLYIRRISIPYTGTPYVKALLLNESTGSVVPLEVSPVQTAVITASQGSILNFDDYLYYQYDYDGAGFQLHIDFEKVARLQCFAGKNYIILSYDFTYFSGDWLLKGIAGNAKKTLEQFEYKDAACTGRVIFDSLNMISIVFLRNKEAETRKQIKPQTSAIPFSSTVAGKQLLMMKKENEETKKGLQKIKKENEKIKKELQKIKQSRGYKLLSDYYRIRDFLCK